MKKKIITMLFATLFIASCTTAEKLTNNVNDTNITKEENNMIIQEEVKLKKEDLINKNFVLSTNNKITIGFDNERIFGSTGINRYFAGYKIKDNKLLIDNNMAMTRAAGPRQDMIQEFQFITSLQENEKISFDGEKLIFTDKHGAIMEMILER